MTEQHGGGTGPDSGQADPARTEERQEETPGGSFVKLAMRNMVRKGRQSLLHFSLTTVGVLGLLLLLASLDRPPLD